MMTKVFAYVCIAWTAYLATGFVIGFIKALLKDLKRSRNG